MLRSLINLMAVTLAIMNSLAGSFRLSDPIQTEAQPQETFSISGTITLSGGIVPMPDVTVTLTPGDLTTITQADGSYTFSGVDAGSYTITPSLAGYIFAPIFLDVTVGPDAVNVNFTGTPLFSISGAVYSDLTVPLAGVTITADPGAYSAITDGSGAYLLVDVPAGDYTLTPSKPEYTFTPDSLPVHLDANQVGIDFQAVQNTYTISGTILDNAAVPVAGVTVSDGAGDTTTTGADGAYLFSGLVAGDYMIAPTKIGFIFDPESRPVHVGPDQTGIDFTAYPVYKISGLVLDNLGNPLAGVTVSAGGQTAVTAGDGTYTITGLLAGQYLVTPSLVGYLFSPVSRTVDLPPNRNAVNFSASPVYTISGTVSFAPGVPLPGVTITVNPGGFTAITGGDGSYAVPGLLSGSYTILPGLAEYTFTPPERVVHLGPDAPNQDFTAAPVVYTISGTILDTSSNPLPGVTVSAGEGHSAVTNNLGQYILVDLLAGDYLVTPSLVDYTFSPPSLNVHVGPSQVNVDFTGIHIVFSVSGVVKDNHDAGIPDVSICAGVNCVTTSADGSYILPGLPAGNYRLVPTKAEFDCNPPYIDFSVPPDLFDQNFICIQRTYSISGTVTHKGNPTAGVTMTVTPGGFTALTAADGTYSIEGLFAGSYTLTPTLSGFLFDPPSLPITIGPSLFGINFSVKDFGIYLPAVMYIPVRTLFFDSFDGGDLGWQPIFSTGGQAGIVNGQFRLYHSQPSQFLAAIAPMPANQIPAEGYEVEVTVTLAQGTDSRIGIVFDWQDTTNFHYFVIQPISQYYWVYRYQSGTYTMIMEGTSPAINPGLGAANTLRLVRRSGDIQVYINDTPQGGLVADPKTINGLLGLQLSVYASAPGEGFYNDFKVSRLP